MAIGSCNTGASVQVRRVIIGLGIVGAVALVAGRVWFVSGPERVGPPPVRPAKNLVVVMGCTLRRDQLSPYGGPAELTPWMGQMGEEGAVFTDLIASSSWTKESSTALFTGFPAATVGMIEPGVGHNDRVLSPQITTLAEQLQGAGWNTIGVTANPNLNALYGLAQGFDQYRDTVSEGFAKRHKIDGTEVVQLALDALDEQEDPSQLMYMRLVLIDPHTPLTVLGREAEVHRQPGVSERLAVYRAGVARVDAALAQLDTGLRERGYTPENTFMVLVTDHGEGLSMPEHHRGQHGRVLYESLTSVPWLVRGPGVVPHRIDGLASHVDVMPTLLGLLEQPISPALPGRDWSDLLQTDATQTDRTEAFSATWYYGARRAAVFTEEMACQRDFGSEGIVDSLFQDGCFDRQTDPTWIRVFQRPTVEAALEDWHRAALVDYEAWADTRDALVGDREALEALGYVE